MGAIIIPKKNPANGTPKESSPGLSDSAPNEVSDHKANLRSAAVNISLVEAPSSSTNSKQNVTVAFEQKKLAEMTAKVEVLNFEIDEKNRLITQLRREYEVLTADSQSIEQKNRNLEFSLQKNRTLLDQLNASIASQTAKQDSLIKTIELYEQQAIEKKESCHQQIATLSAELFEDLERIQALKRQVKETARAEIEKERDAVRGEVEAFKEEAWKKAQSEIERIEEDLQKKRAESQDEVRRILDEAREKGAKLLEQAEEISSGLRHSSEEKARILVEQAQERLSHTQRETEREMAEARRRSDEAEYDFLQEKNSTLARIKSIEKESRQEAEVVLKQAQVTADEELRKAELKATDLINQGNRRATEIIKDADRIAAEIVDREKTALEVQKKMHFDTVERVRALSAETARGILDKAKIEAHQFQIQAQEQARALLQSASDDCHTKQNEALEFAKEKQREAENNAREILERASHEALSIVEKAKGRALNIGLILEEPMNNARRQADSMMAEVKNRYDNVLNDIRNETVRLESLKKEEKKLEYSIKERRKIDAAKEHQRQAFEQQTMNKIKDARKTTILIAAIVGILLGVVTGLTIMNNKGKSGKQSRLGHSSPSAPLFVETNTYSHS